MIVMKFGGSSVANADRIKHVAEIIQAYKGERPVVVLSAMETQQIIFLKLLTWQ